MENQIREFLAQGMAAAEVANLCGVSVEKIQALLQDETFKKSVQDLGATFQAQRVEKKYANAEEKILNAIISKVNDEMTTMGELCRGLETVAKNRVAYRNPASALAPNSPQNFNVVQLILPRAAESTKVVLNSQSEIVAIGERNMASMPLSGVQAIFKSIEDKQKGVTYEHATEASVQKPSTSDSVPAQAVG